MKKTIRCATWVPGKFVPEIAFVSASNPVHTRSGDLNQLKLMQDDSKNPNTEHKEARKIQE
jgi:hypothetical protein